MDQKVIDAVEKLSKRVGTEKVLELISMIEELGLDTSIGLLSIPKTGLNLSKLESKVNLHGTWVAVKC